jgi:hypothetical protein
MGDRPGSFPGCAQVRTKVHRKDCGWSVGLVYDPTELPRVTTTRPRVVGVLQFVRVQTSCIPTSLVGRLILSHFIIMFRHLVIEKRMCVKFYFQIRTKTESKGCSQCQILFSNRNQNWKERLLSMRVAELTTFQCSKVLGIDDNMYPILDDMVHATTLISLSPLLSLSNGCKINNHN